MVLGTRGARTESEEKATDFMTKNGYIDEATEKTFIKGVNVCIKHVQFLQVLRHLCFFYNLYLG